MTAWVLTEEALHDLERHSDFLPEQLPEAAAETGKLIVSALEVLRTHPELVISRGRTGYLALYEYDARHDIVLVLRVRHQSEQSYPAS